jgi:hypothetical protein
VLKTLERFREATHTLYGLPHGILRLFNTILYKNEFQKPQIFQQTISHFPEQSTLVTRDLWAGVSKVFTLGRIINHFIVWRLVNNSPMICRFADNPRNAQ